MNRTTIKNSLRESAGGAMFITRTQLKECFGIGNEKADEVLKGLDHIKFGGDKATKRYDITEVSDRIMAHKIGG